MRRLVKLLLPVCLVLVPTAAAMAEAAPGSTAALSDSLLLETPDFAAVRSHLLTLTTADVAETAWSLVPRLVTLDRPDLLVEFLQFWEDRCGRSEPTVRTRILAAIWDGAFDESLYDEDIAFYLNEWEYRDPALQTSGRLDFDAFMLSFADQLLPHQPESSLPEYFCLLYSDRLGDAADLLAAEPLADTWLRWYRDNPEGADGGLIVAAEADDDTGGAGEGASSLLLTVGGWWSRDDGMLMGDHVLVGGLLEQRLGEWFLRMPIEVRLGRTTRPYLVDQEGVRGYSDRFDAVYIGAEWGRDVLRTGEITLDAFAGVGYDGIRPFQKEDVVLATLNANLGLGLRWRPTGSPLLAGLDGRREWLGARNDGADSLSGDAWSLRLGAGFRFGEPAAAGDGSR